MTKTKYVQEHNIIGVEEYRAHALETLSIIKQALTQSIGYYGSTSILEDNIMGNTVTKDGYTILKQIKFGPADTISNTLLEMIKSISRSLVMEVGDGSTSAVVSSEALFRSLVTSDKYLSGFKDVPPKVINDMLHEIEEEIKEILVGQATPITDDNFERLKDIAAISNNNDDAAGDIIYRIYKEIGRDGFITMENSLGDGEYYEVTDGIELGYGLISKKFTNSSNGFEGTYDNPGIVMVKGKLDKSDLQWFTTMMGRFFQQGAGRPLVIIANDYSAEFTNNLIINKNANSHANIEIAPTVISANNDDEFDDIAVYLHAKVIDKENDEVFQQTIDPFVLNDNTFENNLRMNDFYEMYLGGAKSVFMNLNFTRLIEGKGPKESIEQRVELIERQIQYVEEHQAKHRDVSMDLFKLRKRIGNLRASIAKLYISGNSDVEIETKKYLYEDAIHASKSALDHGYISGGNLSVARIANNIIKTLGDDQKLKRALLEEIRESFLQVYRSVLANTLISDEDIDIIVDRCVNEDSIYNLKTREYDSTTETAVINSVMTDVRIMESVFSIIGLLVTSNQYIQRMARQID